MVRVQRVNRLGKKPANTPAATPSRKTIRASERSILESRIVPEASSLDKIELRRSGRRDSGAGSTPSRLWAGSSDFYVASVPK